LANNGDELAVNRFVALKSINVVPDIEASELSPLGKAVAVACWPFALSLMTILPPVGVITKSVNAPFGVTVLTVPIQVALNFPVPPVIGIVAEAWAMTFDPTTGLIEIENLTASGAGVPPCSVTVAS